MFFIAIIFIAMPKFSHAAEGPEYQALRLGKFYAERDIQRLLNEQSKKGWVYHEHVSFEKNDAIEHVFIFQR